MPGRTGRWCSRPTACPRPCRPRRSARKMLYLDATCPLVSKVHVEAGRHFDAGREIVLIGHAGHRPPAKKTGTSSMPASRP